MTEFGTLRSVGVGPGDPQLITFKAASILRHSTVIAYVVNEQGESFARQVAAAHLPASARELPLHFSMSPQREQRLTTRAEAAHLVLALLATGQDVTFITEGDPLLYSTFQHLLAALPSEIPVEICPGVSSLTASAAAAHFPLVVEQEQMVVAAADVTTLRHLNAWLEQFNVIVLFKVHRHLAALRTALAESGAPSQAILVQRASLDDQVVVVNLADWDGSPPPYFSTLLIRGERGTSGINIASMQRHGSS